MRWAGGIPAVRRARWANETTTSSTFISLSRKVVALNRFGVGPVGMPKAVGAKRAEIHRHVHGYRPGGRKLGREGGIEPFEPLESHRDEEAVEVRPRAQEWQGIRSMDGDPVADGEKL